MGLLKGMDELLEDGKESSAGLEVRQTTEVERVMQWARDEDGDGMVRDHANSVIEGLETWKMKKLYKIRDQGMGLGPDLGLDGQLLQGLKIQPLAAQRESGRKGLMVEEIE